MEPWDTHTHTQTEACDESHATDRPPPPLIGLWSRPHRAACTALICQRLWAAMFWLPLCKWIGKPLISSHVWLWRMPMCLGRKKEILQGGRLSRVLNQTVRTFIQYFFCAHLCFLAEASWIISFNEYYDCVVLFVEPLQCKKTKKLKGEPKSMQVVPLMRITCL